MPGVYIAYPFCAQKCTYCNFASGFLPRELETEYTRALKREADETSWDWTPETVYLGGGTPSRMALADLQDLTARIPGRPWREATLEVAPGDITAERARHSLDARFIPVEDRRHATSEEPAMPADHSPADIDPESGFRLPLPKRADLDAAGQKIYDRVADPKVPGMLKEALAVPADLVLTDMAAPTTGHRATDHLRTIALVEIALEVALEVLKPAGVFVGKVFQGGATGDLLARMKMHFREVRHVKPPASRAESVELYVVALGFKGKEPRGRE